MQRSIYWPVYPDPVPVTTEPIQFGPSGEWLMTYWVSFMRPVTDNKVSDNKDQEINER